MKFNRYLFAFCLVSILLGKPASSQMAKQSICAEKVKANMEATAKISPSVMNTVRSYTFEYSRSRDTCVMIVQYNTEDKMHGKEVQILAINAFTMQPMEGHRNIFLRKPEDTAGIEEAANFLFDRYAQ